MSGQYRQRQRCALCGAGDRLDRVMELAPTPPANEFVGDAERGRSQDLFPLTLLLCGHCGHLQLAEIVDPARLFGNYVYVSGTSPVFVNHFAEYAEQVIARFGLNAGSSVVDVGSNDGTLLRQLQLRGVGNVLGIDPAAEIAREARAAGVPTMEAFFSEALAEELRQSRGPADLLCANNVFAHTEDLAAFTRGVRTLLADEGVFVFEVSYLLDVLGKLLFDTIYHEHLSYHAVTPLVRFFDSLGLRLFDVERMSTHGGSLRAFVCRAGAGHANTERLAALMEQEREAALFDPATYARFKQRISERGAAIRERLSTIRAGGGRVAGFGAPAKLTTLMHEFGIGADTIEFIVDDSRWKQGRYTPGMHIPVLPGAELLARRPDYCVVFAWNFADSIIEKNKSFTTQGGHFLVPLPEMKEVP